MTQKYIGYELICDHCGKKYRNDDCGIVAMPSKEEIREMASNDYDTWINIGGRDLCPDCYHIDEDIDDYVENKED